MKKKKIVKMINDLENRIRGLEKLCDLLLEGNKNRTKEIRELKEQIEEESNLPSSLVQC